MRSGPPGFDAMDVDVMGWEQIKAVQCSLIIVRCSFFSSQLNVCNTLIIGDFKYQTELSV